MTRLVVFPMDSAASILAATMHNTFKPENSQTKSSPTRLGVSSAPLWSPRKLLAGFACRLFWVACGSVACLAAGASTARAAAITVNAVCEVGNCLNPDVLPFGGNTSGTFDFTFVFANTDRYRLEGAFAASSSRQTGFLLSDLSLSIRYLGNDSGSGSAEETLVVDFLQNFANPFQGATSHDAFEFVFGDFSGGFLGATTAQAQAFIGATALPVMGPFAPPGSFAASFVGLTVPDAPNPLLFDYRYSVTFGAGTLPGARVRFSLTPPQPVPEPALLPMAVVGALAFASRRRSIDRGPRSTADRVQRNRLLRTSSLTLVAVLSALVGTAEAQEVVFDVKTRLRDKPATAVAKSGVVSYLSRSTWARVAERGETCALWLKNYKHASSGDRHTVELDVEVQVPKAFGEGAVKAVRHLSVTYDVSKANGLMGPQEQRAALDLESDRAIQALVLTLGSSAAARLFESPRDRAVAKRAVMLAGQDLQRSPSFEETVECFAVGSRVMELLEEMRTRREF